MRYIKLKVRMSSRFGNLTIKDDRENTLKVKVDISTEVITFTHTSIFIAKEGETPRIQHHFNNESVLFEIEDSIEGTVVSRYLRSGEIVYRESNFLVIEGI